MKTKSIIKTIIMSSAIALFMTSCKKEPLTNSTTDPATVAAIEGMRTAYNNAKTYNDSLNYWYNMDSTHYIGMMHYCDSLYHNCNTIMMNNYNTMNSGGAMMNGNTPSGGMMNGGTSNNTSNGGMMSGGTNNGSMMNGNNTTMNCTINGYSCATMINSLHQHHIHHPIQ